MGRLTFIYILINVISSIIFILKKIVNYIENSVGKKIYVFDYTEYYQGAFDELNIRTGNIKYYKTPLYYYLLKKYLNKVDLNK